METRFRLGWHRAILLAGLTACTAAKSPADIPVDAAGSPLDAIAPTTDADRDGGLELDLGVESDAGVAADLGVDPDPDAAVPAGYRDMVLASGPVAYWPFDETTGTVSTDIVGGRVLTSNGGVTMATPSLIAGGGDAIRFEGTGWAAMAASDPSLQHNPYSIEVWVRASTGAPHDVPFFIGSRDSDATSTRGYQLAHHQPLGQLVADQGTGGEWLAMRSPFALEQTYHVVMTYDGAQARLYIDGSLLDSETGAFSPSALPLVVGADSTVPGRYPLHGVMDELAYYDRALTLAEIDAHHERGRAP